MWRPAVRGCSLQARRQRRTARIRSPIRPERTRPQPGDRDDWIYGEWPTTRAVEEQSAGIRGGPYAPISEKQVGYDKKPSAVPEREHIQAYRQRCSNCGLRRPRELRR